MQDRELERYSRHINLSKFGYDAQRALTKARVLVVGLGGLGSPAALYLAAAGVGHLTLVDFDDVEQSNLQRQIIHDQNSIGIPKAQSAATRCRAINPDITVVAENQPLNADNLAQLMADIDLVVDCCDNFPTRHLINRACIQAQRPWVSAAAIRFDGQLSAFDPRIQGSPCYACLYPDTGQTRADSCSATGVLGPVVGLLGVAEALEAIKLLSGCGQSVVGRLLLFDGLAHSWNEIALPQRPDCPACGAGSAS